MFEIRINESHPLLSQELVLQRSPKSLPLPESQKGPCHDVFQPRNPHPRRHGSQEFPTRSGDGSGHSYRIWTTHHRERLHVPHMDPLPITHGLKPGLCAVIPSDCVRVSGNHNLSVRVRGPDPEVIRVRSFHPCDIRRLKLQIMWLHAEHAGHHHRIGMPFHEKSVHLVRDFGG